jgi:2-polyprenyl-3-methyl-5-hydroxy-6-metoxy-1,4-benzoquinol methylase
VSDPDIPETGGRTADTSSDEYAERLVALQGVWWKRVLNVQAPYRWNLRRMQLGRVLDVGCGIGRNLAALPGGGVGVDHNASCVGVARSLGLIAYVPDEFHRSKHAVRAGYDSLLIAHVLEHLDEGDADALLDEYLPYLRPGGRVAMITPQERGYASDASHVRFVDFAGLRRQASRSGLHEERAYSFPFPRRFGKAFVYNEFCFVAATGQP